LYFTDSEINFDNKYLTTFLDSCIENNLFFLSSAYLLAKDLDEELINKMSKF
jgi:hypothetical protein